MYKRGWESAVMAIDADKMICKDCRQRTEASIGGRCPACHKIATEKWQAKMAIRMDEGQFDLREVINCLLTQHWMHECKIIPDYMPPFPDEDTKPTCQVCYAAYEDGSKHFLRYSRGPLQGHFWDVYGSDFLIPEIALVALASAPPPPRVGIVIQTYGR